MAEASEPHKGRVQSTASNLVGAVRVGEHTHCSLGFSRRLSSGFVVMVRGGRRHAVEGLAWRLCLVLKRPGGIAYPKEIEMHVYPTHKWYAAQIQAAAMTGRYTYEGLADFAGGPKAK
eukprot:scaffold100286_cov23-Tisochrysis_lutea.AAC.2